MRPVLLGVWIGALLAAQSLPERIEAILDGSEVARRGYWGVRVVNLGDGSPVYERNADRGFVPASNAKLLSTALALSRLGPEFRFVTTVVADSPTLDNGTAGGDVRLVGAGDPNLSARVLPYKDDSFGPDPLRDIAELAEQMVAKGLRRVEGNIVGDDTAFVYEPYPEGWSIDDAIWEYGAPVSALSVNDNAVSVTVTGGAKAGDLPLVAISPPMDELVVLNHVRTVAFGSTHIEIERLPGGNELTLRGQIVHAGSYPTKLAIEDPALFAARALRNELVKRGVQVMGAAVARHRDPDNKRPTAVGIELARHVSHPYIEDLQVTAKESQNLHAELAVLQVARARTGIGSRKAALDEMKAFLSEMGIPPSAYYLRDGSGLSRMTLLTPSALCTVLTRMYNSPLRDAWLSLLPVGGEDGTLKNRFTSARKMGVRVYAKTGTITHVAALSGYVFAEDRSYAFSVMVNNLNGSAAEARGVIDKIVLTLVDGN